MRPLAVRLLALGLGVVLALGAGEVLLRILAPSPAESEGRRWLSAQGQPDFRDRAHDLNKQPGTFRILAIGDSFTWGHGVAESDAYPDQLERRLEELEADRPLEVLNWSHPGWNTLEEWRSVKSRLTELQPDLVIVGFVLNDPVPTGRDERRRLHQPMHRQAPASALGLWLHSHSRLFLALYQAAENPRIRRQLTRYYHELYEQGPGWDDCRRALRRLKASSRQLDAPLVLVVFPVFDSKIDDSYAYHDIHSTLAALCGELELRCLDLRSSYAGVDARDLAVDPFIDAHPTRLANEIAADAILEYLVDESLLPGRRKARLTRPVTSYLRPTYLQVNG